MRKLELRDDVPLLGYKPEQVPREPQGIGHGRGPTDHAILRPRGEPTVGQTGSVVRGRDGHDAPDLPAYLVRLLIPATALQRLRTGEKLGIDAARAVADQVDALDAGDGPLGAGEARCAEVAQVLDQVVLPLCERVGGQRGARDDGDRVAERLFEEPTQDRKEAVREVVEAPEAGEAEKPRDENHNIRRLHGRTSRQARHVTRRPAIREFSGFGLSGSGGVHRTPGAVPARATVAVQRASRQPTRRKDSFAHPAPEVDRAALADAMEFLRAALADGERPATEVLTEATALGIAEITLRRARKALRVNVRRQGFGPDGRFLLALPSNGSDAAAVASPSN